MWSDIASETGTTRCVTIIIYYAVSRVPANLCTNLYCHMQEGAGTRAT